jgi:Zn-dependent M28 family amino/carboxypeptidase
VRPAPLSSALLLLLASACGEGSAGEPGSDGGSESGSATGSGDASETEAGAETGGELHQPICASELSESMRPEAIAAHLEALHAIAIANGGNRAAGSAGYEASAAYVEAQLQGAGYLVTRWPFAFDRYVEFSPATLTRLADQPSSYTLDVDYAVPQWAPAGQVNARIEAVDLALGPDNASTSGCEPEDFASFTAGNIALVQRGSCTFAIKAANAEAAGAVAMLLFNQGSSPEREGLFTGTLGSQSQLTAPVLFTTHALGLALASAAALDSVFVELSIDSGTVETQTFNILAETPTGDPEQVIMLGAHLDSVPAGPGVNDNGSGSASVLELARQFASCTPNNRVRFAWWGAEEWGLHGSRLWVDSLDDQALAQLAMYLNFDMVASPNYVRFVHSGQGAAAGSTLIHDAFLEWFDAHELPTSPAPFTGNSDYQPFVNAGVRAGGLATGAGGGKSQSQAETFGGVAGEPYDLCYHQACDDVANFNLEVLGHNTQAAAHVLEKWATDLGSLADAREIVTVVQDLTPDPGCGHTHE